MQLHQKPLLLLKQHLLLHTAFRSLMALKKSVALRLLPLKPPLAKRANIA